MEIDLPQAQSVSDVIVYAGVPWQNMGTLLDYDLQFWDGAAWNTIEHVSEPANTFPVYTPTVRCTADSFFSDRWIFPQHFAPVVTSKLRLLVNEVTWGGGATADVVQAGGQTGPHQIVLREIEIYNRPVLPVITASPSSQSATLGDDVTLAVAATGDSLQYQWQFNGANLAGATGPTLTLPDVALGQQGVYTAVVSNAAGSVTSAEAFLTVALSFDDWLAEYFGGLVTHGRTSAISSPSAPDSDPNGDGIPNLLEYVFGDQPGDGKVGGGYGQAALPEHGDDRRRNVLRLFFQ